MLYQKTIGVIAFCGALMLPLAGAWAFDDAMYPDLKGQWHRAIANGPRFDQSKPPGRGQGAPVQGRLADRRYHLGRQGHVARGLREEVSLLDRAEPTCRALSRSSTRAL